MIVTQISIDLSGKYRYEYVVAKQGDADSRLIQVMLISDSRIYVIDDQTTARVSITKPDKTEVIQDCVVNNNMVEVLLDANMLAAAGVAEAEILLTDESGTVTSASFDIKVVATKTGKNAESSDDYGSFKEAMAYLQAEKKALIEAKENGEFDGVGIKSVEQTTKSTEDDGINIITVEKTDDTKHTFEIKNGSKGSKGDTGTGIKSVEQTTKSTEDDGINIITVEKTDDTKHTFEIKNGSKGSKGDTGDSAYEHAVTGGYEGTQAEFEEALASVGNQLNKNLFSFKDANKNLAFLSKSKPDQGYIYAQNGNYGYKDTENGYFVFPASGSNIGITDGLELPLKPGSYKVSADIYIPSANTTKTFVNFGAYVAPSKYADFVEYDLGALDAWITVSKVFTVEENDTHVYIFGNNAREATGTYEFYMRNIKVVSINSDDEESESIKVKKWVVMGDSITEKNGKTLKNYHDYIAELTGINVINMGYSGSGYKKYEDTGNAFYQRILNVPTNTDVVTILGSGNDLSGYTLGNATDTGTDTLCGCINKTIDNLYSVLPTVQLGIITPNPWGAYNPSDDTNLMAQYSAKIVEICRLRGIPCLDLYHCSGMRPWDGEFLELAYPMNEAGTGRDTVHPNEVGHLIIAPRIKAFLESLIM